MNSGVKPLGGRTATSPVIQKELNEFFSYRAEVLGLGVVNSEEKALAYRSILAKRIPGIIPVFQGAGYKW